MVMLSAEVHTYKAVFEYNPHYDLLVLHSNNCHLDGCLGPTKTHKTGGVFILEFCLELAG